jgi:hypothetical protein
MKRTYEKPTLTKGPTLQAVTAVSEVKPAPV